ncbi:MAG TPA: tRNA 2-thiouridine(34) synthase MnmA [Longilinea sp.]|nr:tRNA 2-thiouridine(34) synthase MnmA [Longilinea sp.]
MSEKPSVVVGMSGGVDSSVAAALLVSQGYQVTGIMLRLWSQPCMEESNRCCTPEAMAQARRIAAMLGIPFYALDVQERFRNTVVESFIQGYSNGMTPNPCLVCNRQIRWGFMLDQALALGADYLATGHYARIEYSDDGKVRLIRASDPNKDQSYVLSGLSQEQLRHSMFPLGGMKKSDVRELARQFSLPVAERADSQDLCFLAGGDYREFLLRYAVKEMKPGKIITREGKILGEHQGLAAYTIGQRKGLGIAAPEPFYVLEKNLAENTLVIGFKDELGQSTLKTGVVNWISGNAPETDIRVQVKIRYRADLAWGILHSTPDGCSVVDFDRPLRDITAGQQAVFYDGDQVLGGGIIQP